VGLDKKRGSYLYILVGTKEVYAGKHLYCLVRWWGNGFSSLWGRNR